MQSNNINPSPALIEHKTDKDIATLVNKQELPNFIKVLKRLGLFVFEDEHLNISSYTSEEVVIKYSKKQYISAINYDIKLLDKGTLLEEDIKEKYNLLDNDTFKMLFEKSDKIFIILTVDEKEEIGHIAKELELSMSQLFLFIAGNIDSSNVSLNDYKRAKRKEELKKNKTKFQIRISTVDREELTSKANICGMSLSEFFVVSVLNYKLNISI